jgi:hypothetical protein
MTVWDTLTNSRKAIVATVGAGLAAVSAALATLPAGASLGDISTLGWVGIGQAILVAAGGTYLVSNRPAPVAGRTVATAEAPVVDTSHGPVN